MLHWIDRQNIFKHNWKWHTSKSSYPARPARKARSKSLLDFRPRVYHVCQVINEGHENDLRMFSRHSTPNRQSVPEDPTLLLCKYASHHEILAQHAQRRKKHKLVWIYSRPFRDPWIMLNLYKPGTCFKTDAFIVSRCQWSNPTYDDYWVPVTGVEHRGGQGLRREVPLLTVWSYSACLAQTVGNWRHNSAPQWQANRDMWKITHRIGRMVNVPVVWMLGKRQDKHWITKMGQEVLKRSTTLIEKFGFRLQHGTKLSKILQRQKMELCFTSKRLRDARACCLLDNFVCVNCLVCVGWCVRDLCPFFAFRRLSNLDCSNLG